MKDKEKLEEIITRLKAKYPMSESQEKQIRALFDWSRSESLGLIKDDEMEGVK